MRNLLRIGFLSLLLADVMISIDDYPIATINSDVIGPFETFQENVSIAFRYSLSIQTENVSEEMKTFNPKSGRQYTKERKMAHLVPGPTKKLTVYFELDLHEFFGNDGLTIEFSLLRDGSSFASKKATIYPAEKSSIYVSKDKIERFQSKDVAFKIEDGSVKMLSDDFNFVGFKDYVDADYYYALDLKENCFLYNLETLNYKSANLSFYDENNVFKYLPHIGTRVDIDLLIADDGVRKGFTYKKVFYVNRLTLEIANYKMPNFIETNMLYLPVNRKNDLIGTQMQIILHSCGLSKNEIIFDIKYDVFRELIGNCSTSDYCIRGEVD